MDAGQDAEARRGTQPGTIWMRPRGPLALRWRDAGGFLADASLYIVRDAFDIWRWATPSERLKGLAPTALTGRILLNEGEGKFTGSAARLAIELTALRHVIEREALVGGRIDYDSLRDSAHLEALRQASAPLRNVRPESFATDAERIAFWINLYNVLTVHGVLALGLHRSAMESPSLFARVCYRVGSWTFSPNDIINGVLRRGARRPGALRRQFRPDDPRGAFYPQTVDPRMHGALVCVASSCPPVAFYDPPDLDRQLDVAARHLIAETACVDADRRRLLLPLQLLYYSSDFGDRRNMRDFVLRYAAEDACTAIDQAFRERWRVQWIPYDWSLNDVG